MTHGLHRVINCVFALSCPPPLIPPQPTTPPLTSPPPSNPRLPLDPPQDGRVCAAYTIYCESIITPRLLFLNTPLGGRGVSKRRMLSFFSRSHCVCGLNRIIRCIHLLCVKLMFGFPHCLENLIGVCFSLRIPGILNLLYILYIIGMY